MNSPRVRTPALTLVVLVLAALVYFVVGNRHGDIASTQPAGDRSSAVRPDAEPNTKPDGLSAAAITAERVAATSQSATLATESTGPGSVFGRVTDEDGLVLVGIRMRYEPLVGRVVDAVTDLEGNYAIESLALERGSLRSASEGYVPFKTSVELTSTQMHARVDVVLAESHRLNITLRRPDGAQFMQDWSADANLFEDLHLTFGPTRPRIGEEVPADDRVDAVQIGMGWPNAPLGVWRVIETPGVRGTFACLSLGLLVIDAQPVPLHADTLFLVADIDSVRDKLGHVTAFVVDATTGLPVEGATLSFGTQAGAGSRVTSDSSGHVRSRDLVPGMYRLSIFNDEHLPLETFCNVVTGKDTDLGVLKLDPGIRLSGRVEFPDGNTGVARITCCQLYPLRDRIFAGIRKTVSSAADGTFSFTTLQPGRYALLPESPGATDSESRDVTALVAGQLIVDAEGESQSGIVVRVPRPKSADR